VGGGGGRGREGEGLNILCCECLKESKRGRIVDFIHCSYTH